MGTNGGARPGRRPTLLDVGRLAGTSTAVVSYVLNGGPRPVSAKTRVKVEEAIQMLGYRRNPLAGALSGGRSNLIGLLVPDTANAFFGELSRHIEAEGRRRGMLTLLGNTGYQPSLGDDYGEAFSELRPRGIFVTTGGEPRREDETPRVGRAGPGDRAEPEPEPRDPAHRRSAGTETRSAAARPGTAGDGGAAERQGVSHRRGLQYVFQNPYGSLNPHRSVVSSLLVPLRHYFGMSAHEGGKRVREALERVEIPARLAGRRPAELSGGQRQRVAIARALVCGPKLLICDEVTSALDVSVQASVVELLRSLLADGLSMIFVTHDLAVVRSIADGVVVLSQGRVVESGAADPVLTAPAHPYTRSLIAATLEGAAAVPPPGTAAAPAGGPVRTSRPRCG